jgi:hypothetical protein
VALVKPYVERKKKSVNDESSSRIKSPDTHISPAAEKDLEKFSAHENSTWDDHI